MILRLSTSSERFETEVREVRFFTILLMLCKITVMSWKRNPQAILRWAVVPCWGARADDEQTNLSPHNKLGGSNALSLYTAVGSDLLPRGSRRGPGK
jgi:hypothetical protein